MTKRFFDTALSILKSKVFLYSAGGLAGLFVLLNYVIMPWYVYHGGTLTVPDVTKIPYEEALKRLDEAGLVAVESDKVLDNQYPAGTVLIQNPEAGAIVKHGRHVYLTICGGELQVVVPSLRGRSLRDARFAIERNGLVVGDVYYAASDSSPVNTVISQTLTPSERVKKGTPISITVSSGRESSTIEVPDLTGKSFSEAERILTRMGLKVGQIFFQPSAELLPNTIIGQLPLPGSPVDSATTVDLYVVKLGKLPDEN